MKREVLRVFRRYLRNVRPLTFPITLTLLERSGDADSHDGNNPRSVAIASARAFVHSLNILVKYVRLYGFDHKRTEGQFQITWNELQNGLPTRVTPASCLGVTGSQLLLDGAPLETGQAERSFAQLLTTAGLASIHFSQKVTKDDFIRLVRAFTVGGSKAQDVAKQIKEHFRRQPEVDHPDQRSQIHCRRSVDR